MIRTIPGIAGACILSIALGFLVGKGSTPKAEESESAGHVRTLGRERTSSRTDRTRGGDSPEFLSSLLKGRGARDIPPTELAQIIGMLSKGDSDKGDPLDRARRNYQLQMLLAQLSTAQLEEIATAASGDEEAKKNGTVRTILMELAGKDPDRALDWAASQENSSGLLSMVISEIAGTDPDKASTLFRKNLMDGTLEGNSIWQASQGISRAMAKLGALPLIDFMDSLPERYQSSIVNSTMGVLPEGEETILLDEFHRRESVDGNNRNYLQYVFANAVTKNPKAAEAWLDGLTDNGTKATLQSEAAERLMQNGDTAAALDWMARAYGSSPGKEKKLFINATQGMAYNNPADIAKFAAALPPGIEITASDLAQSGQQAFYAGLGSLATISGAIRNPDEKAQFLVESLARYSVSGASNGRTGSAGFDILARRIAEIGFTGANLEKVSTALEEARQAAGK